jgi:integrase
MEQVDERFLESFKEYLQTCNTRHTLYQKRLSQNSILSYYSKVRAALREAYNAKLIRENPSDRVKGVKAAEPNRHYLSLEDLQQLAKTPCELPELKKRFLFSCLTGLRWSDIDKLKWSELTYNQKTGWSIHFTQKKTKQTEFLPISQQAINLLGELKSGDTLVFGKVKYSNWTNLKLREWMLAAEVKKKITFHCGRHTFATLQLAHDTDIYTVSKLLGHKHLKTTEVYTKVIDKRKIDAAERIPSIF